MEFLTSRRTEKTYLMGAWPSKGSFKDDKTGQMKDYDSTKIRLLQTDRVAGGNRALGIGDHSWGDSTNFEKIKHLDPTRMGPILVEIEYEPEVRTAKTADGRSIDVESKNIIDLRPIELASPVVKGNVKAVA